MIHDMKVGQSGALVCPMCGGECLHHSGVMSFVRDQEDGEARRYGYGSWPTALSNPSARRDGTVIQFYCETCPATPMLCIAQHKGESLVYWSTRD